VLVAEGLSRSDNTVTAVGVLCVVVAIIASTAGAWKLSGLGFEVEKREPATLIERPYEVRSLE
jgi:hypothetical protein